jgi:hypothetical protein
MLLITYAQAVAIDQSKGNSSWKDSESMKMKQLAELKTFGD